MLAKEKASFNGKRTLFTIIIVLIAAMVLTYLMPEDASEFGAFSLIPAVFLIIYIFATQRILEALVLSSLIGFIMVSRPATMGGGHWLTNILSNFSDGLL